VAKLSVVICSRYPQVNGVLDGDRVFDLPVYGANSSISSLNIRYVCARVCACGKGPGGSITPLRMNNFCEGTGKLCESEWNVQISKVYSYSGEHKVCLCAVC